MKGRGRDRCALALIAAALAASAAPARAFPRAMLAGGAEDRRWGATLFVGQHDRKNFTEILTLDGGDLGSSYLAGVALSRHFATSWRYLHWELEGSTYGHWGEQSLWEANAALVTRWTQLPWDPWLDTSIALGQGISFASERPPIEEDTRRFLHHLLAELEVTPVRRSALSLVLRVHHRSGAYGVYGTSGGSNFLTLGLRYRF